MTTAQLAAVSYLAGYAGRTAHAYQRAQWFDWCQKNGLDALVRSSVPTWSCTSAGRATDR